MKIDVTGDNVPTNCPLKTFQEMNLDKALYQNIKKRAGYAAPSPIQSYAIPIVLHKRDLMAQAQTGILLLTGHLIVYRLTQVTT